MWWLSWEVSCLCKLSQRCQTQWRWTWDSTAHRQVKTGTGDWERASWLEAYNLIHQEERGAHWTWGWESKQDRGTKEEGSFEQLAWWIHREPTGEVLDVMETRLLKLEQHSLSCSNSDVGVESVPQTSKITINEPIKCSFMWWTAIFFCWLTTKKLYAMFKVKKHCFLMAKTASSINTFLPTAFILLGGLKMWQQCAAWQSTGLILFLIQRVKIDSEFWAETRPWCQEFQKPSLFK